MTTVQIFRSRKTAVALGMVLLSCCLAPVAQAQSTYTWDATGVSQLWGDGGNWVGGVGPSLAGGPGTSDSAIFSAGTNTVIKLPDNSNGVPVQNLTFDASAPAYTWANFADHADNDLEILTGTGITNLSSHTQDFTGIPDIYLDADGSNNTSVIATGGDASTNLSFKFKNIFYSNGGGLPTITGSFNTSIGAYTGLNASQMLYKMGSGTLFVTGNNTGVLGQLGIGAPNSTTPGPMGAVRISANNALGAANGTGANGNYTQIFGNSNNDGRLELTNNITTNEGIILAARQNGSATFGYNNALNPAIVNVSGNNTMTGPFLMQTGGAGYNFASTSGTLTVTSNINWNLSGNRYLTNQGAGNTTFSGSLSNGHTTSGSPDGALSIDQLGSGTLTLGGAANANLWNLVASGGTIAVGATAGFSFDPSITSSGLPAQVFVQNNGTFDVSAVSGGFTLTQSLQGTGNVVGSLKMASGTQVVPGGGALLTDYGVTGVTFGVGSLHFQNGLDMSAGSTMVWHLGALSTYAPGTNFDQLVVNGNLALGGSSSLSIDLSLLPAGQQPGGGDPFWNASHTWTIISNTNNPGATNFASLVGASVATGAFSTTYSPPAVPGDVDHNGVVNGLDIALIASNWLATGAPGIPGDANNNGVVNGLDISLIAAHWLQTGGLGGLVLTYTPNGPSAAVPEPSTILLAGLGLGGLVAIRRQRR